MGAINIEQLEVNTTLFNLIRSKKISIEDKLVKIEQLLNESPTPNINAQDSNYNNNTPLHMAIETNELKLVDLILAQGASPILRNKNEFTALEWAEQLKSSQDIVAALQRSILALSVELTDKTHSVPNQENSDHTKQRISKKYIIEFDSDDCTHSGKIEAQKEVNTFKVLKIKKTTVKQVLTLLQEDAFITMLNLNTHLFLIAIYVNDDIAVDESELKQLHEVINQCKALIIQLKSSKCERSRIFYRQPFQSILLLEQDWTQTLSEDELIDELTICDLPLILKALHFGLGGTFDGDLLSTILDVTYEIDTWRFIDYAARKDDVLSLQYLLLFEWDLFKQNMDGRRILEIVAEYAGPQCMKALLDLPDTNFRTELLSPSWQRDLLSLKDARNLTPFLITTAFGKVETLNLLIDCGVIDDYKKATHLAWNTQAYEKIISLLNADAPFPENFDVNDLVNGHPNEILTKIVTDRERFHKAIKENSIDDIELFTRNNLHIKQAFNIRNQSALTTAARSKQWDVFIFLQSKGFRVGDHEELELTDEDRQNLKLVKLKYFRKQDNSHIIYLLSKSKLGHEGDYFSNIKELFEQLDEIPYVSTVLQVLEKSNIQEIVFDFNKNSVVDLDPTLSNSTAGSCDHVTGNLYIGAKQPSNILLGTLAHELTHFAVQTVYNNECNPYAIWDTETKKDFQQIIEKYQYNEDIDEIISRVFKNYQPGDRSAELIVRIPHLLAFYYKLGVTKEEQLETLKKKVPELLKFYTTKVQKAFIEFIETPARFRNQHLNDLLQEVDMISQSNIRLKPDSILNLQDFDFKQNNIILTSSIPKLAKIALFQGLEKMEVISKIKSRFIFTTLDHFKSQDIVLKIRNSFKSDLEQTLIVDCTVEYDLHKETLWATILSFDAQKKTIIIGDTTLANRLFKEKGNKVRLIQKEYAWSDLNTESQSNLLKKIVDFQGYPVALDKLVRTDSDFAKNIPLASLMETSTIKIGNSLPVSYGYDESYYIQRTFKEDSQYFSFSNIVDLLERVKHEKVLLIADRAGMGKSTILTHFSKKFKIEDPSLWIMRFDLNNHTDVLEEEKCKTKTRKWEGTEAINFLRWKLLKLKSSLEECVFWDMLEMRKIIVMFDGFDEVSPFYNKIIIDLLAGLKQSSIGQLWITTRPHLTKHLTRKLKPICCTLKPFTFDDQLDFLTRFWAKSIELLADKAKIKIFALSLIKILSKSIADRDRELASVPLQARMLAEAFQEELLEFYSSNKPHPELPQKLDLLDVYKRFLHRKYLVYIFEKNNQLKINVARENLAHILSGGINLRKIHQQLALQVLFPRQKEKLLEFHKKRSLTAEELNRIGIVQFEYDKFDFVHRTFAEYYVSDFFMNNLMKSNRISPAVVDVFLDIVLLYEVHFVTRNFINNFLTCGEFKISEINLKYIGDKIKELWKKDWLKTTDEGTIIHVAIRENDINIVEFLIQCLKTAGHVDTLKSFYESEDRYGKSIWNAAIEEGRYDIVDLLWTTYKEINQNSTTQELKALLMSLTRNQQTCWTLSVALNLEQIFDKLICFAKEVKLNPDDLIYLALHEDSYAFRIWYRAAYRDQAWVFQKLFALAKSIGFQSIHYRKLLLTIDEVRGTVWHSMAYGNSAEVYEELHNWVNASKLELSDLRVILCSTNGLEETVWHCSASYNSPAIRSSLSSWRKEVKLRIVDVDDEPSLIEEFCKWAMQSGLSAKEIKQELLRENKLGQTVWHLAIEFKDEIIAHQLVNVVRKHLKIDIKDFFLELITKIYPRGSLWQMAVKSKDSFTLEILWDWIREAQLDSEQIKQIILERCDGRNAWHLAAISYDTDMLVSLWKYAKKSRLSEGDLKNLLFERDKYGVTVWHYIIKVDDLRTFDKLLKLLGKGFAPTPSEFKTLLSEKLRFNRCSTWHSILEWGRHKLLVRLLQVINDKELCRELIVSKNIDDCNAFHLAAASRNCNVFDSLLKWLHKAEWSTEEITQQISYRNHLGRTALFCAVAAKNLKAAITLLELGADVGDLNEKQCNSLKMFIQRSKSCTTLATQAIDTRLTELSRQSNEIHLEATVSTQEEELNPFDVLDFS